MTVTDRRTLTLESLEHLNPLKLITWDWLDRPVSREEIAAYIEGGRFRDKPYPLYGDPDWSQDQYTRENEIARIAYLVVNPDYTPIELLGSGTMMDGHHRLAAAFYRGDAHIEAVTVSFS